MQWYFLSNAIWSFAFSGRIIVSSQSCYEQKRVYPSSTFDLLNDRAIARNSIGYHCSFWLNEHYGAEFRWYTALSWRANYRLRSNDVLTAKFNRAKWRILYRTLTFNKLADNSTDTGIVPLKSAWPLFSVVSRICAASWLYRIRIHVFSTRMGESCRRLRLGVLPYRKAIERELLTIPLSLQDKVD